MSTNLDAALSYLDDGFSVIPVGKAKKPFIKWEDYQNRLATHEELSEWWERWPDAGIGIVTGKLSGVSAIDFDLYKEGAVEIPDLPESVEIPTSQTPRGGKHLFFLYDERIPQTSEVAGNKGLDCRNDGGYIIVPPTKNGSGFYKWLIPLTRSALTPMPDSITNIINKSFSLYKSNKDANISTDNKGQHETTFDNISFSEGHRDEALFHLANHLVKGRMPSANIEQYLRFVASHCSPPYPQSEINIKIQSAMKRASDRSMNLTRDIKEWVLTTNGNFSTTLIYNCLHLTTREEKKTAGVILGRLASDGIIESLGKRSGEYRLVNHDCEEIDFLAPVDDPLDILFPLDIHELVEIMPGNIVIIAGEPNAGKTSWLFNFVKMNMHKFNITYFNSEMGREELQKRLTKIEDVKITDWKCKFYERSEDFADVIRQGKGNINIIDYLEIYSDFWEVGRYIAEIHHKLNGAVAVIALQKNPNTDVGLGGYRTIEKARLALAISHGRMDIKKAKNWKTHENPNGKYCEFKIIQGGHMYPTSSWLKDKK